MILAKLGICAGLVNEFRQRDSRVVFVNKSRVFVFMGHKLRDKLLLQVDKFSIKQADLFCALFFGRLLNAVFFKKRAVCAKIYKNVNPFFFTLGN